MEYYVINSSEDYADEFDYPVVSVMTETERDILINTYNIWKNDNFDELYFGTNEYLTFYPEDILSMIKGAEKLSEEEYKYFHRFSTDASVDVTDAITDTLYDHFGSKYEIISKLPYKEAVEKFPEYFV